MSKRLTRKQIKEDIRHDEFSTALSSGFDQFQRHQNLIIGLVIGIFAVAIGAAVFRSYLASRDLAASNELSKAIKIYTAPIQEEEAKPDDPKEPSFASENDRRSRAKEAMAGISGGNAEKLASLFLADLAVREGDKDTARNHWQSFDGSNGSDILAVSVRLNLIKLARDDGKAAEVAEELKAELETEDKSMPEEIILFELAQTLDTLDRGDEAKEYYQRILDDFPQSPYSTTARQKTTS